MKAIVEFFDGRKSYVAAGFVAIIAANYLAAAFGQPEFLTPRMAEGLMWLAGALGIAGAAGKADKARKAAKEVTEAIVAVLALYRDVSAEKGSPDLGNSSGRRAD